MIHGVVVKSGYVCDVVVASSLVGMYAKFNLFGDSVQVFDEMPERDVAGWNAVMSCFYQSGEAEKAMELFDRMERSGFEPNSVSLTVAVSACSRLLCLERGEEIHRKYVKKGFESDEYVSSALVDMYGKCGCLEMAIEVFEHMPRKSLVAWNSMIRGLVGKRDSESCIELLSRMIIEGTRPSQTTLTSILMACSRSSNLRHGKFVHGYVIRSFVEADVFMNCSLIDLYFKCGDVKEVSRIFKSMPEKDVVSWTVMISAYGSHGQPREALHHFDETQKLGVKPDSVTFLALLSACGHAGFIDEGIKFFNEMGSKYGVKPSVEHYSCLIDILGRAGRLLEAYDIIQQKTEMRDDAELLRTLSSPPVACTGTIHWEIESRGCFWRDIQMMHQPTRPCSVCMLLVSLGVQQGKSD
ncbi:hypothetical protein F2Q68_00036622 [Brassica cretica]|uniref:Pentatricopeptide repeat-containing protein n=1 Tax=Brassica cretica TaxID=69181 RepID=A0A8S9H2A8_BRACR|nr:hypothetical protein F2Q68_00036622 [Brassica cretica]